MKKVSVLFIILLFSFCARFIYLEADPPLVVTNLSGSSSLYCDDGIYPHNARNKILFGRWVTDDWNPFLYNPILTGIYYGAFLLFGVQIAVVKIINILFGCLVIALFYLIATKELDFLWSALITLFFSFNLYLITFNKTGLLENFLMLCLILTFYFFSKSLHNINYGFLVGLFTTLIGISKFLFIPFLVVPTLAVWLVCYQRKHYKLLVYYLSGGIFTGFLWLLLIFLPNQPFFTKIGGSWSSQSLPQSIKEGLVNLLFNPLPRFMVLIPFLLLFVCFYLGKFLTDFLNRSVESTRVFIFLWITLLLVEIGIFSYQPLRYHMPLMLGCFMALIFIVKDLLERKKNLQWGLVIGVFILGIVFWRFFPYLVKKPSAFFVFPPPIRILLWMGYLSLLILPIIKSLQIRKYVLVGILLLALTSNLFLYQRFFLNPTFHIKGASMQIQQLPQNSFLTGQAAPRLAFDSKLQTILAYPGWFNDRNTFQRFPVTHIISVEKYNEHRWIKKRYPQQFSQFRKVAKLPYWDTHFILWELTKEQKP